MKKPLLILSVLTCLSNLFGQTQIPNSGFENWENITFKNIMYEDLSDGWASEICVSIDEEASCEITANKSTDARSGNFALEVTTNGFLVALLDHSFTEKPTGVEFYSKSSLTDGESGSFTLAITNDSIFNGPENNISQIELTIEGSSEYTRYYSPITYEENQLVSLITVFYGVDSERDDATYLVDDLKLIYDDPTGIEDEIISKLAYPTVIENELNIDPSVKNYVLYNSSGQILKHGNEQLVNTQNLNQGSYYLQLETANGSSQTTKLIKY